MFFARDKVWDTKFLECEKFTKGLNEPFTKTWIIIFFSRYKICGTWKICESLKWIESPIESVKYWKKRNGNYNFFFYIYKYLNEKWLDYVNEAWSKF